MLYQFLFPISEACPTFAEHPHPVADDDEAAAVAASEDTFASDAFASA